MITITLINILIITTAVIVHYECLLSLNLLMPRLNLWHRFRMVFGVLGTLIAHAVEVWIFAVGYYVMNRSETLGRLSGNFDGSLMDSVYFSFTTFTTIGFGDITPSGPLKFLTGLEALTGLVLITWTASFLFIEMQKYFGATSSRPKARSSDASTKHYRMAPKTSLHDKAQCLISRQALNDHSVTLSNRAARQCLQPRGLTMNDLTLRRTILDELEFLPHIDAAAIGVSIENGVVILNGHVGTYAEKIAAERAVKRVKGVRAVAEELKVRATTAVGFGDEVTASRCLDLLRWNTVVPDEQIQIKVQQAGVTLEGNVEWQHQKEAAQKAIQKLDGVVGLNNLLVIRPKADAQDIKRLIEEALARSSDLNASKIRVVVEGNEVKLEGTVERWLERKEVEQAAWAVPGVTNVENRLLII